MVQLDKSLRETSLEGSGGGLTKKTGQLPVIVMRRWKLPLFLVV
jgi:hypothetical protein